MCNVVIISTIIINPVSYPYVMSYLPFTTPIHTRETLLLTILNYGYRSVLLSFSSLKKFGMFVRDHFLMNTKNILFLSNSLHIRHYVFIQLCSQFKRTMLYRPYHITKMTFISKISFIYCCQCNIKNDLHWPVKRWTTHIIYYYCVQKKLVLSYHETLEFDTKRLHVWIKIYNTQT